MSEKVERYMWTKSDMASVLPEDVEQFGNSWGYVSYVDYARLVTEHKELKKIFISCAAKGCIICSTPPE